METFIWACAAAGLMTGGGWMVLCPAAAAVHDREDKADRSPVSPGEILTMRLAGLAAFLGGAYTLYAILAGIPGADGV
jgi:hypothetical protein